MQWTALDTDDAFLVSDFNGDGLINDGSELFGVGTDMVDQGRKAWQGYEALAQYDQTSLGGNGDGTINDEDQIWSDLLLWVDSNADGVSEAEELMTLSEKNITEISVDYKTTPERQDSAGNFLPLRSWVTTDNRRGPKKLKMVDVYFKFL